MKRMGDSIKLKELAMFALMWADFARQFFRLEPLGEEFRGIQSIVDAPSFESLLPKPREGEG